MKLKHYIAAICILFVFQAKSQTWSGSTPGNIYYDQGKVGIGTANPSYQLTVTTADENHFRFDNGVESAFMRLNDNGDFNIWAHGDDALIFMRGNGSGTESMRINSSGNVGIGTSNLASKFAIHESASTSNYLRVTNSSTGDGSGNGTLYGIDANDGASLWNYENTEMYFGTNNQRRMTVSASGDVGLGTINPSYKLTINSADEDHLRIENGAELAFMKLNDNGDFNIWAHGDDALIFTRGTGSGVESMRINSSGNVGIGTSNLASKFAIHESTATSNYLRVTNSSTEDGSGNGTLYGIDASNGASLWNYESTEMYFGTGNQRRMTITSSGNIGIGISNPDEKLSVDGTIQGEEVRVEIVNGPDYVFEPDYDLPTLESIEQFIKSEKHLPEIPPAKEMEANGVELGEMNMLLLKKIEELTLYQIQLLSIFKRQEQEIVNLKNEVNNLHKK